MNQDQSIIDLPNDEKLLSRELDVNGAKYRLAVLYHPRD